MIVSCVRCKYQDNVPINSVWLRRNGETTPDVWICVSCAKEVIG